MDSRDESRIFWCHKCEHMVFVQAPDTNLACPCCGDSFLEQAPAPASAPAPRGSSPVPQVADIFEAVGSTMRRDSYQHFHPFARSLLDDLEDSPFFPTRIGGGGGGGGGLVVLRGGDMPPRWLFHGRDPSEFGSDGLGLERLIQQLIELEGVGGGTPPATRQQIDSMPTITVTREHLRDGGGEFSSCAVCTDDFAAGNKVRQLPCKHIYHHDCILPWLALHGSCPVCRCEVGRSPAASGPSSSSSSSGSSRGSSRVFPWPFRRR